MQAIGMEQIFAITPALKVWDLSLLPEVWTKIGIAAHDGSRRPENVRRMFNLGSREFGGMLWVKLGIKA